MKKPKLKFPLPALFGCLLLALLFNCSRDFNNPLDPRNPNRLQVPLPPDSLIAAAVSQSVIRLQWKDGSGNEEGVIVERKTSGSGYLVIDTLPPGAASYEDSAGLAVNTYYFYRIAAYNSAGTSTGVETGVKTLNSIMVMFVALADGDTVYQAANDIDVRVSVFSSSIAYVSINGVGAQQKPGNEGIYHTIVHLDSTDGSMNPVSARAYSLAGNIDSLDIILFYKTPLDTPPPPDSLTATPQSTSSILLSWKKSKDAVSYEIYRASALAGPYTYISDNQSLSFEDKGLADSTTYIYKVKAVNRIGVSGYSAAASARTNDPPLTAPAAPSGITAHGVSSSAIQLAWQPAARAESYMLYRAMNADTLYQYVADTGATGFRDNGLVDTTKYYYRVKAKNSAGESPLSSPVWAYTQAKPQLPPAKPTGIGASALSSSVIRITWPSVANASSYCLYRSPTAAGSYGFIKEITLSAFDDSTLQPSTPYYYKVTAKNSAGQSPYSDSAVATTQAPPQLPPAKPAGIGATALSSSVIRISWSTVASADSYYVFRSPSAAGTYSQIKSVVSTNLQDSGLTPSTPYYYKLKAKNNAGPSPFSDSAFATTQAPPQQPPVKPTGIGALALSSTAIRISWSSVANADSYYVYQAPGAAGPYTRIKTIAALSYDDNALTPSTPYYYKLKAKNNAGPSPFSDSAFAATQDPPLLPPAPPSNVGAVAASSSSINVNWSASTGATAYSVFRSTDPTGTYDSIATVNSPDISYADSGLQDLTAYYYKVKAGNGAGASVLSNYAAATTLAPPDAAPPTVTITSPTVISTYSTDSRTISLGGSAGDNVGVTAVTWSSDRGGSGTAAGTTSWSAAGIALQTGANVITATAHDAAGNIASASITVTCTPGDTIPPQVSITSPTPAFTNSSILILSGTASDNIGIAQVRWSNNTSSGNAIFDSTTWFSGNIGLLSGNNDITITAKDSAGNTATAQRSIYFDNVLPSGSTAADGSISGIGTQVSVYVNAIDNESGVASVSIDGTVGNPVLVMVNDQGTNTYSAEVRDKAGNSFVFSFTIEGY